VTAVLRVWCQLCRVLIMAVKMVSSNMQIRQPCHVVTCRYLHMKVTGIISFTYFFSGIALETHFTFVNYESISKIFRTDAVKSNKNKNKRVWKLPTSTQLRATWHTDSLDMVVLPSTGASRYTTAVLMAAPVWNILDITSSDTGISVAY
jgi:hypothetical protein